MDLLFGSAYYPEYLTIDRCEQDIQLMRRCGMNTIRIAESTWSTMEPNEGEYNFSYIDRALEMAEKYGIHVIIGTPTYAIPAWLVKKDPTILVETKHGRMHYGHRQIFDLLNPTFRKNAEIIISKLLAHTASHPSVIGFQVDNETKHYDNFGIRIQHEFKNFLKDKYGTVEALNAAFGLSYWSNALGSWDDFPDMKGCINGNLMTEYEAFRRQQVTEFLGWQVDMVNSYRRADQFVTHNLDFAWKKFGAAIAQDGYSYGVQPDVNHVDVARLLTTAGCDIYHPTQDLLTGAEIAFCGDEIRCTKAKNYFVLETQAQGFKYWTPYPGQMRLHAYSHLASGAQSLLYWNWGSIHNGYETYWKGVLSHDLAANPIYDEVSRVGHELEKYGAENLVISKENNVAFVVDNRTLTAFEWFPIDKDCSYNDVLRWVYDCLYELNIECDIVHASNLDPEKYTVIITPALYCVSENLTCKLRKFVQDGGVLISTFKSFVADEKASVYQDGLPHGLTEVFGMSYQLHTDPGRAMLSGQKTQYIAELLTTKHATPVMNYEHSYWDKYAGVTANSYGNGKAWYIGARTTKAVLKEIISEAIGRKHEKDRIMWPMIIRSGINQKGKKIHYVLHYSEDTHFFQCPFENVVELFSGQQYTKENNIEMKDWDVLILEECCSS